jgi:transposase
MRGDDRRQGGMFSYISPEDRVPKDHPLRIVRGLVDSILKEMSPRFAALYSRTGRPSIAPEMLLRALLLQVFYTIRSERQLMEQLDYNLLFRWFVGLNMDDPIWDASTFSKNRDRLLAGNIAQAFLQGVLKAAEERSLLSHDHFSVDGTLLDAWASQKSFVPRDKTTNRSVDDNDPGNPSVNFRGEKRTNETHFSRTDPDARLAAKSGGTAARPRYLGNALVDNRHSLVVGTLVTQPGFHAEGDAALELLSALDPSPRRRTIGGDKGYDRGTFVKDARALGFTPHIAPNVHAKRFKSDVDGRTTRHTGFAISQRMRKRSEEYFGWAKTTGLLNHIRHRGRDLVGWVFTFTAAAYDLIRIRTLIRAGVCP